MDNTTLEIADICVELEKLSNANVFSQRTENACTQAISLLMKMREIILDTREEPDPNGPALCKLKWLLSQQGEG
jgi:hypothetical protein